VKTTQLAMDHCPWCRFQIDAASGVRHERPPERGDITMCIECGEWSVFDGRKLKLRKPTDAEYDDIAAKPDARDARSAWLMMQMKRGKAR
jgi:hypothetical protein